MDNDLNPLTLGDTPEDYSENDDGSVDVPMDDLGPESSGEWLENLAEVISKEVLNDIASDLSDLVEKDKKSREKRDQQYEEGLRRAGLGEDAPGGAEFEGASKVVHPVLAEACVDFSSRAIKELFPASGPVKAWVNGEVTSDKLEKSERKTRFMNWQLTTQMEEYRDELEQLLTQLPMGGSQYQKFWRDDKRKRICCEFVGVDEIFLPYAATNFYTAQRVTHRQLITRSTFKSRVKSGLYRDVFISDSQTVPEVSATTMANDKIEGREEDGYNEDGLRAVLEIHCWYDVEEDAHAEDEAAPYIITIDEDTTEILAIYRNWNENDVTFKKLDWFVKWGFIPWRGAYDIGLPHLIGGLAAALTGALRATLDSAHINNAPTMLKLSGARTVGQSTSVNVTEVCTIDGPAGIDDVRKLAMAMPFNPPSPVLVQLMDSLYGLAKNVVATADDQISQVGDRTPVGTTMAMIEQGSNTYSAIHARLHESQKRALAIIHRLNALYLDDVASIEDLGGLTISREDFIGTMDVVPVSDPTIFSEAQRFAQSQAIMQMAAQDAQNPSIPWDQVAVRRRMLKQMRIDGIDELLPAKKNPLTADAVSETDTALMGNPIKAGQTQDHFGHIQAHLALVSAPWIAQNPMIPPPVIQNVLQHINEHILMLQTETVSKAAHAMMSHPEFQGTSPDSMVIQAIQEAGKILGQMLQPITQQIGQLQQALQQRTPPPPQPPEVQASVQIAKMDIDRKSALDQATIQMKQQESAAKDQTEQAKTAMAQAKQQFEQQAEQQRRQFEQWVTTQEAQAKVREAEANRQLELLRNQQTSHAHQMTELLKNRDDNATAVLIEEMKNHVGSLKESMTPISEPTQDLAPQLQQMQAMLDQIGKSQTSDALATVMQGLQATIEHMGRPKTVVYGADGKVQGIQ